MIIISCIYKDFTLLVTKDQVTASRIIWFFIKWSINLMNVPNEGNYFNTKNKFQQRLFIHSLKTNFFKAQSKIVMSVLILRDGDMPYRKIRYFLFTRPGKML